MMLAVMSSLVKGQHEVAHSATRVWRPEAPDEKSTMTALMYFVVVVFGMVMFYLGRQFGKQHKGKEEGRHYNQKAKVSDDEDSGDKDSYDEDTEEDSVTKKRCTRRTRRKATSRSKATQTTQAFVRNAEVQSQTTYRGSMAQRWSQPRFVALPWFEHGYYEQR
eukprot:NODE_384_length_1614_cov_2.792174.p3 GENE.NODE_384_length_1614_cov_2.792174~~NODE_384_length_1614_cov_2.792174.p3  ORF type:complete len:163 (-),score=43.16 NODE_384_length_1614_cov_2.792174:316-804(-)